jgi:translation initiation factor 1A
MCTRARSRYERCAAALPSSPKYSRILSYPHTRTLTHSFIYSQGGKNRRRGKNEGEEKRELELKTEGQEYAKVLRMLGNGRLEGANNRRNRSFRVTGTPLSHTHAHTRTHLTATCFDGHTRQCHIRGKMRKKVWVGVGDIVLISLRDFQDDKADVILKYAPEEARQLKAQGHLPESVVINDNAEGDEEGGFEFEDDSGDDAESVDVDVDNV